jgi:hypothetical protein
MELRADGTMAMSEAIPPQGFIDARVTLRADSCRRPEAADRVVTGVGS